MQIHWKFGKYSVTSQERNNHGIRIARYDSILLHFSHSSWVTVEKVRCDVHIEDDQWHRNHNEYLTLIVWEWKLSAKLLGSSRQNVDYDAGSCSLQFDISFNLHMFTLKCQI